MTHIITKYSKLDLLNNWKIRYLLPWDPSQLSLDSYDVKRNIYYLISFQQSWLVDVNGCTYHMFDITVLIISQFQDIHKFQKEIHNTTY